jgi:hypothetical protein
MLGLIRRLRARRLESKFRKAGMHEYQHPGFAKFYPCFERLPRKQYEPTQEVTMVRTARNTWEPMMVDWGKDKEKRG